MLKDKQEFLVFGELMLFLLAWGLGIAAAVDNYRDRTNAKADNNVASKSSYTDTGFYTPMYSDQFGRIE